MAKFKHISEVKTGIKYRNKSVKNDVSFLSKIELKERAFRSKNTSFRTNKSRIKIPEKVFKMAFKSYVIELKKRGEYLYFEL